MAVARAAEAAGRGLGPLVARVEVRAEVESSQGGEWAVGAMEEVGADTEEVGRAV